MRKAKVGDFEVVLVSPRDDVSKRSAPIPPDQKVFSHDYNLSLEFFAQSLFGDKYHKSVDRHDIGFWKKFYVATFEVLQASVFSSIGSVDRAHRRDIEEHIDRSLKWIREAETKDKIHGALVVSLFKLTFLLLGRLPYAEKGKRRDLATFRTLTYSQTDEQLSWLLQGFVQRNAVEHGFQDIFDADYAFLLWTRENKRQRSDRTAYVEWVRTQFPETYALFR